MKIHYFIPVLAALVLLGQGCTVFNQGQDQDAPETPETSMEKMENDDLTEADSFMEGDSAEKEDGEAMEGADDTETPAPIMATKEYRGFWFDIQYPETFTASPNGPTYESRGGTTDVQTDAAQFESPDGLVAFYVYSPLWSGDPDYLQVASNETLVDEKTTEVPEENPELGMVVTKWATIRANDGSYTRSYVSIREQVGSGSDLHHVFGIKYANQAAYDQYRDEYLRFKNSLRQYSD